MDSWERVEYLLKDSTVVFYARKMQEFMNKICCNNFFVIFVEPFGFLGTELCESFEVKTEEQHNHVVLNIIAVDSR